MTPIHVDLSLLPLPERQRQEATLATLPRTFHLGPGAGSVIAIDGSQPSWPERWADLADDRRTPGVFITAPVAFPGAREACLSSPPVPTAIDSQWVYHPGWRQAEGRLGEDAAGLTIVDVLTTVPHPDAQILALLEQLRWLDHLHLSDIDPRHALAIVHADGHTVVAQSTYGPKLNLVASAGPRPSMRIRLLGQACRWFIECVGLSPTSQISMKRMDAEGTWQPPACYGSSTHEAWLKLARLMEADQPSTPPAPDVLRAIAWHERLTAASEPLHREPPT